jgi:hypothetical protein
MKSLNLPLDHDMYIITRFLRRKTSLQHILISRGDIYWTSFMIPSYAGKTKEVGIAIRESNTEHDFLESYQDRTR